MDKFIEHTGSAVPWVVDNVDTDQIMPKQFLTRIERTGYGQFLFHNQRFDSEGNPKEDFILNEPKFCNASVLITGHNFGCGSSREHAPWGLYQYGFRVIIAVSFADIFRNNCYKNGLLTVALEEATVHELAEKALNISGYRISVDLESKSLTDSEGFETVFEIEEFYRNRLLNGLDDIGLTEQYGEEISQFEKQHFV